MRPTVRRALALGAAMLALGGCAAARPELWLRRNGMLADAFGFACECGNQVFEVLGRPAFGAYRLRCPDCHREWLVRDERAAEVRP